MFQHWKIRQYKGALRGFLGSVEEDDSALDIMEGSEEIFETVLLLLLTFEETVEIDVCPF